MKNGFSRKRTIILSYAWEKGCSVVRSPEKQLKRSLPKSVKPNIFFTGTKLSSNFNVKDPVPSSKKYDVLYRSVCATESCNEDYVGGCARRLYDREKDHNGRDHLSHLVKHAGETGHLLVDTANFEVIASGYRNNARRGKIAETLLVKKMKATFNIQGEAVLLTLLIRQRYVKMLHHRDQTFIDFKHFFPQLLFRFLLSILILIAYMLS